MLAKEIMTKDVIVVEEDSPISKAVELMLAHGISGVPVVDSRGRLSGMLSESDLILGEGTPQVPHKLLDAIVRLLMGESDARASAADDLAARMAQIGQAQVAEYMTAPVYAIMADAPMEEAAALITTHDINRVPVVDEREQVVGIISRHDLLKGMYQ